MICYPVGVSEIDVLVIDDYWRGHFGDRADFSYRLVDINHAHRFGGVRNISKLVKESFFALNSKKFVCVCCGVVDPVSSRAQLIERVKVFEFRCSECQRVAREELLDRSSQVVEKFKKDNLAHFDYVDNLDIVESIFLFSIVAGKMDLRFPVAGNSSEICVTGVPAIDYSVFSSLLEKKAFFCVDSLPPEVESASNSIRVVRGASRGRADKLNKSVVSPDNVYRGVYVLCPAEDCDAGDLLNMLHVRITRDRLSLEEVSRMRQIVTEIKQVGLYELVKEVAREFKMQTENSPALQALLLHLAGRYSPIKLFFTFHAQAGRAVIYQHKKGIYSFAQRHLFTKFLGNYINYIEERGSELNLSKALPPSVGGAPFETFFCNFYLEGHFDWSRLSAREVISIWLERVEIEAEMPALQGQKNSGDSMAV